MRNLWNVTIKDMLIVGKDRGAWIFLLITPLIVITVASFALGPAFEGGSIEAELLLADEDGGAVSSGLVEAFRKNENVVVVDAGRGECEALEKDGQEYEVALVIPAGFSGAVEAGGRAELEVFVDPNSNITRPFLVSVIQGTASRLSAVEVAAKVSVLEVMKVAPGADAAAVAGTAAAAAASELEDEPVQAAISNVGGVEDLNPFDTQAPGYSVMFMLFGVMTAAEGLLLERESGTLGRLLVAPVSRASILGGKLLAQFAIAILQITLLFTVGHFVFGMNLGNSIAGLALMIVVTAWTATAFGILLASMVKTRRQLSAVGILSVLLMSALGGSWWPLDIVPEFMRQLGHLTINAWALDGLNDLILRGKGLDAVLPEAGVLLAYGAVCFIIGIRMFRFRSVS
ncbi:MAG: ABC transporter permease [Gaiellales bacterium]|nr:MAG: ABC transporter permease [Gaiellales bacterium]